MRPIEFRVWDKKNKKMVYYDKDCNVPNMTLNGVLEKCCFGRDVPGIAVHTNVSYQYDLMQFTGLLDKNGKKIWEGDIVRYKWMPVFEADNGLYDFTEKIIGWEFDNIVTVGFNTTKGAYTLGDAVYAEQYLKNELEVIGNIHEPEDK